jgi:anti-sigma factor RsiW
MKNIIAIILLSVAAFTGCKLSPERIAYNATATTITTADAAIRAWFAYVSAEKQRISSLRVTEPEAAAKASNALAEKENKVRAVWDRYTSAARLAVATGANAGQYDQAAVDALQTELIGLVATLAR